MSRVDRFHNDVDSQINEDHLAETEEISQKRQRSEPHERNFVRRALRQGVPTKDIEVRLPTTTEFHRLNPERDPTSYVRGLIDGEASSLRNADLTDAPTAYPGATANSSITRTHVASEERAVQSEAIARRYIQDNFEAADWLAVLVRNHETGETVQRITTARKIASHEFQSWLPQECTWVRHLPEFEHTEGACPRSHQIRREGNPPSISRPGRGRSAEARSDL